MTDTYLIYGGSGGIGSAVARALKARGATVHLAGRNASELEAVAGTLGTDFTVGDVSDPAFFEAATAAAGQTLKGIVYAVGTINLKPIGRLSDADFETDFMINALGAARAARAALPVLKAGEGVGAMLFFSTVAVAQGFAAHASVAMAKGAIEGLTVALAAELAPKIRVNAIAPSLTRTNLAKGLTANDQMSTAIAQMHAIPRLGEPEDIGPLAALLMSDDAGWITGQIIGVDGGRSTLRTKG